MNIAPGTLCVIEPKPGMPFGIEDQVAGLVVVTVARRDGRFGPGWRVAPDVHVVTRKGGIDADGRRRSSGTRTRTSIPEAWLRPLRGRPETAVERTEQVQLTD